MLLFVSTHSCEANLAGGEKWFCFPPPSFIASAVSKTWLYPSALQDASANTGVTWPNIFEADTDPHKENKVIFDVVVM